MITIEYGIKEIKFLPANADGSFPDFNNNEGAKLVHLIVMDSFNEDQEQGQNIDLFIEEQAEPVSNISESGKRTITFQSNDLSPEQYAYFMGFVPKEGYDTETPGFVLPPQAMRLITKAIDRYPAKEREWARLDVKVKKAGINGKNRLPFIQFDIHIPANIDSNGNVVPGYRERFVQYENILTDDLGNILTDESGNTLLFE